MIRTCRFSLPMMLMVVFSTIAGAEIHRKPQLPVELMIAPADQTIMPQTMRPGDVVDLIVTTSARMDITAARIEARLLSGAELAKGSLTWSGPAAKREQMQLLFSVRLPAQGTGKTKVTVTFLYKGKQVMKRSAQYILGADKDVGERRPSHMMKKDAQGRDIIEY